MADIIQRVFMIFTRPYVMDSGSIAIKTTGLAVLTDPGDMGGDPPVPPTYTPVQTNNTIGSDLSTLPINAGATYKKDIWMLHSTYTSYEEFRINLRLLLSTYPAGAVLSASYIPTGYIVTPFE